MQNCNGVGNLAAKEEIRLAFRHCVTDEDKFAKIDELISKDWGSQLASFYALTKYEFEYMCSRYGLETINYFESSYARLFASAQ